MGKRLTKNKAILEILRGVKTNFGWYIDGVKVLMTASELRAGGLLGPLAGHLDIPKGYEEAVEVVLGGCLAWLLVRDRTLTLTALDYAESCGLGRLGFICRG